MGKEVRIGVIGVGMIGKSHISTYQKIPDARLVAVCDVDKEEAQKVAAQYKIPKVLTDFRKLLKMPGLDAVDVCLHNNLHSPVTIAALEAGKHVYCEKPMAGSYCDSKAMYDAARRTGMKLHIQLSTLYSSEHKTAKRLIKEGRLGKLYYARSYGFRRRGRPWVDGYGTPPFVQKKAAAGGALFDMGIYHMAQILDLLGNPKVLTVSGATHQELPMYEDRAKKAGYDVEEFGVGFVRLAGGISLDVEESWALHHDGSEASKVCGSKGGVKLSPFTFFTSAGDVEISATADLSGADFRWHACNPMYNAYDGSQQHWIAALQNRVPLLDTAGIALNVSLISEGIYRSQELKRELTAAEIGKASKSSALKV
ncbi:MAG: Gfo/Idh/MocA family oxidoreductase [Planctomycetota bacterium]|nr:Gfo/Idh/MocA family oxidoreductase [Planctomycetota bacterium]